MDVDAIFSQNRGVQILYLNTFPARLSTMSANQFSLPHFPPTKTSIHPPPTVCMGPAFLDISALPSQPLRLRPLHTRTDRRRIGCIRPEG